MTDVLVWLGVAAFGALGALQRFRVASAVTARHSSDFPYGTFAVNISGGLALGVMTGLSLSGDSLLLLGTGFMGSYTTFSTWMVEAQRLGEKREWALMWLYLVGSTFAGLAATGLGWLLGSLVG